MEDQLLQPAPAWWEPPEDDPELAAAARELRRAVEAAAPEDRALVLGLLEDLARRFGARGPS